MKRRTKIFIGIAVFIVAVVVAAGLYVDNLIEKFVNRELKTLVDNQKDNFKIQVGEVKSGFLLNQITINDVYIKALNPEGREKTPDFELNLSKLVLKLYDYSDVLSNRELKVKEIELDEPNLLLNFAVDTLKPETKTRKKFGSELFDKIRVDNISINNGTLNLNKKDSISNTQILKIKNVGLNVASVVLDLDSTSTESKFEYRDFGFNLSGIDFYKIPDHLLKIGKIKYLSSNEYLNLQNVQFDNANSLEEFKKKAVFNTPWVNLNIFEIKFKIPVNQVLDKNIHLELFEIGHIALDIYQNNTLPAKKKENFSYAKLLKKINFPLTIDTIRLLPSEVSLNLIDKEIKTEEEFILKDFEADVLHVSSDTVYQQQHPELDIALQSKIWDNVPISIQLNLAVDSASDRLEGKVRMRNLSYEKIEGMIEKRIDINLHSGYVDNFYFDFLLLNKNLQGNLDLAVHNIRVNTNKLILPEKIKDVRASLDGLKLKAAFNRKLGKKGKLIIDTLLLQKPDISWVNIDEKNKTTPEKVKVKTADVLFKTYQINYYDLDKLSINVYKISRDNKPLVSVSDGWIKSKSIRVSSNRDGTMVYKPGNLSFGLSKVSFNNTTSNFFEINQIEYKKQKGLLKLIGIRYKSNGSKFDYLSRKIKDKFWAGGYIENIAVDFDILKIIDRNYRIKKIKIQNPIFTYVNDPDDKASKTGDNKRKQSSPKVSFTIDKIVFDRADIKYSIRTKENKEHKVLLANKINCRISNFSNDPQVLKIHPQLELDLIGLAYGQTHLNVVAKIDQRQAKDRVDLKVDLTNISLQELNNRFKPFIHQDFNVGKLDEINLVIQRRDKRITGNVSIKNLEVENFELGDRKAHPDLFSAKIPTLKADFSRNGNDPKPVLRIASIDLKKPEIELKNHTKDKVKKPFINRPVFASYGNDPGLIIDNLNIKYAKFSWFFDDDVKAYSAIRNANLSVGGIRFYKAGAKTILPLSVQNLVLEAKEISRVNSPEIFMNVSSIKYDLKKERLTINNLKVKSTKSLADLYRGEKYRKPWFDVYVPKVGVSFDLNDVVNTNPHIRKIDIDGTKFLFKFDYKLEINPDTKPMFVDMIKAPKIPYSVDTVAIEHSTATIYMQENTPERSGYLIFNDINATVHNITNDPKIIEKRPETLINAKTTLWGEGKAKINGKISLTSPDKYFNLSGTVDTMDMSVADTLIADLFNMSIKSGRINRAKFNIDFNEKQSKGSVWFDYKKLKVSLYKGQHEVKSNLDTMSLATVDKKEKLNSKFMAGVIVNGLIREKNLPGKGNYVIGSTAFVREPDKPVFRYVWYSLAEGLLEVSESGLIRTIRSFGKGGGKEKKNQKGKKE